MNRLIRMIVLQASVVHARYTIARSCIYAICSMLILLVAETVGRLLIPLAVPPVVVLENNRRSSRFRPDKMLLNASEPKL